MWSTTYATKTNATPAQIWGLWSDVSSWPRWDPHVEHSFIEGQFAVGTVGYLKPKGGPRIRFKLTSVKTLEGFTDRSFLPLTTLDFIHSLKQENGSLWVEHRVEMRGPLTFIFKHLVGKNIADGLPKAVENLARIAAMI